MVWWADGGGQPSPLTRCGGNPGKRNRERDWYHFVTPLSSAAGAALIFVEVNDGALLPSVSEVPARRAMIKNAGESEVTTAHQFVWPESAALRPETAVQRMGVIPATIAFGKNLPSV